MTRHLFPFVFLLASALASASDRDPPTFRLGDAASPTSYDVRLAIDPREKRFEGEIHIELEFARSAPVLWLNATQLEIEQAGMIQRERRIDVQVVPGGGDFVGFEALGGPFDQGVAALTIRFRGPIEELTTRGLFRQQEAGEWYAVTQLEEHWARRVFPCFDEPHFKAPWRIAIDAPAGNVVVSNAPEAGEDELPGRPGWRRHRFERTSPLPTYLVAFAIGPYDVVDGGTAGMKPTRLRYFAPKGRGAEARHAREATPALLESLERYFGTEFPFEKLDAVTIPQTVYFGAMENAGMITYATNLLLAKPYEESPVFRRRYASVAAHEIAHQWFGDLVTLAWWDDAWLNEAFATWMGHKVIADVKPEWDRGWQAGERRRRAAQADRLASARQVHQPVLNDDDIANAFDAITYDKGGEVLSMLEAWLAPERFRQGVRDYLRRYAWRNATSADFFTAVGEASGRREETLAAFRAFVEQPGVPLLDAALRCEGAPRIEVTQQRLIPAGSNAAAAHWVTPACFRYPAKGKVETACAEIGDAAASIALASSPACPDWVLGNALGAGHYVTRYEAALLHRIAARAAKLPGKESIALVGDAALLADTGLLPVAEALSLARAFLGHPSNAVKQGAVVLIDRQYDTWLSEQDRAAKHAIVRRDVLPLARRVGWHERTTDPDELRELRAALLPFAAKMDEGASLRPQARTDALRWFQRRDAEAATMVQGVLDTAARFADAQAYEAFGQALRATANRRDRMMILRAMSKIRDAELRGRAFDLVLRKEGGSDVIDGRDAYQFIEDALDDELNHGVMFAFVREHFDALVAKLPPDAAGHFSVRLGNHVCEKEARDTFADFYRERAHRFRGGERDYKQALEAMDICIAARRK